MSQFTPSESSPYIERLRRPSRRRRSRWPVEAVLGYLAVAAVGLTVPYVAIKTGRKGIGIELSSAYWCYGVQFCTRLESDLHTPTLFDMIDETSSKPDEVTA